MSVYIRGPVPLRQPNKGRERRHLHARTQPAASRRPTLQEIRKRVEAKR